MIGIIYNITAIALFIESLNTHINSYVYISKSCGIRLVNLVRDGLLYKAKIIMLWSNSGESS